MVCPVQMWQIDEGKVIALTRGRSHRAAEGLTDKRQIAETFFGDAVDTI